MEADPDPNKHWVEVYKGQYLQDQRAAFWRAAGARMQVVINEPGMGQCNLADMGVTVRQTHTARN